MATGAFIQAKINYGGAIAARQIGDPYEQYRAYGTGAPIAPANLLGFLQAQFGADPALKFARGQTYGKPFFYGVVDISVLNPGDYLVGLLGTFFVCDIERFSPGMFVQANRTVTISRMQSEVSPGLQTQYGGNVQADDTPVITSWPAAIMNMGSKGAANAMQMPNDSKLGTMNVLLPVSVPVTLFVNDIVTDDLGNQYAVSAAELTALGWRLTVDMWKQG
jgi:hypothetical protein